MQHHGVWYTDPIFWKKLMPPYPKQTILLHIFLIILTYHNNQENMFTYNSWPTNRTEWPNGLQNNMESVHFTVRLKKNYVKPQFRQPTSATRCRQACSCAQISTMPWKCMGESMHRFMYSWPWHHLQVSGQFHTTSALPSKTPQYLKYIKKFSIPRKVMTPRN
jgi:hypothetical protein